MLPSRPAATAPRSLLALLIAVAMALSAVAGAPPADATTVPDRVLSGDVDLPDGFIVPPGETWAFDPDTTTTVTVRGNVVVHGRFEMQPSSGDVVHTLHFAGIDESRIVGKHVHHPVDTDVGVWVVPGGQVDWRGTPTAGWNRTGDDPTWDADHDIRVAPQRTGDHRTFASFTPGDPVPTVTAPDGSVHPSEVFDLTRNVRVLGGGRNPAKMLTTNGRAHVTFLGCTVAQHVSDVELRWLGPRRRARKPKWDGVVGRYPLHFHKCGDGSRGSLVERVVVRDSGNRAFVPHASNGITFRDTVAFSVWESAYWWDVGSDQASHDVLYDHAAAFGVRDWPRTRGHNLAAFELGEGTGNAVRDSVAVGTLGQGVNSGGFMWPSHANSSHSVWGFTGNVAHNNQSAGIGVWQNDHGEHEVAEFVSYRNRGGLLHGAYINRYRYRDGLSFDERFVVRALGGIRFDRLDIEHLEIRKHKLDANGTTRWTDLTVHNPILVAEKRGRGTIEFHSTSPEHDLTPSDFRVRRTTSLITVHNSDGSTFRVRR